MAEHDPSRTEEATPKRRSKLRDEGNVAKSQELPKVIVLLAGLLAAKMCFGLLNTEMRDVFQVYLREAFRAEIGLSSVYGMMLDGSWRLAKMTLPILCLVALAALVVQRWQIGPVWAPKVFNPNFGVLNPVSGLKKVMLSKETAVNLAKQIAIASAIAWPAYLVLKGEMDNMLTLFHQEAPGLAAYMLGAAEKMLWYALAPMLVLGLADLWYARWDFENNIKMTKGEIKDEVKQAEGDQTVKGKQRQKMFALLKSRPLEAVPKADVIITNPTHFAVALQYDPLVAPAPIVVAKGADHLALKIKEIAREHSVPIRENKPLARALYSDVEVGQAIPEELYKAVAGILAEIFKIKGRKRK